MTRFHLLLASALALVSPALAHTASCAPQLPGVGIDYRSGQLLDAFAPSGEPRPAALVIHGRSGNRRTHINQLLEVLERSGWSWFSIDYRNLADIENASRFVQCPGRFNILPKPVLIGEDTGAALAIQLASTGGFQSVAAFGIDTAAALKDPRIPILMFHGGADDEFPLHPAQLACANWQQCTFITVPNAIHNLENWHPDQWSWKEDLTAWLRADRHGIWRDIVYQRPGGQPLAMDAFLPEGPGPFPAVIVVHGGGWEAGDKQTYVSPALDVLARSGLVYFSIDYRLTPYVRNAQQLDDVRNAIRYVRLHAQRFHVNSNRISLLGESAGGQLVTQVASLPCPDCSVNAVVSLYGVYDFAQFTPQPDGQKMLTRIFGDWKLPDLQAASPIHHINSALPPLLLIQGTQDELYAGTLAYDKALTAAVIPHKLIVLEGAPHGMENWVGHPAWMQSLTDAAAWLKKQ